MANPPLYVPSYSFSGWQASNPSKPLPADRVDNEYATISISLNATIDALEDIRRSDGQLQNGIVGVDALSTGVSPGFVLRGQWAAGVHYLAADSVVYNNVFYRANVAHDSAAGNRPDLAPSIWVALFSVASLSGAMSTFIYDPNNHMADAFARENHTGVQAISTITALQTSLDAKFDKTGGAFTGDLDLGGNDIRKVATLNDGPLGGTRNQIINGDFSIWQRGTSQTASGYGSDDRWNNEHVGSTKTASQQAFAIGQTAVPGNPQFFSRTVVNSVVGVGNYVRKTQRIEGVRKYAGSTITLTLYGAADASRNIAVEFVQNFGTGGSPSPAVTGIGSQLFALTTTAAKKSVTIAIPSVAGKTLGSNGDDYLELVIWYDAGSSFATRAASLGQQSGTFDISHVSVVAGDATQEVDPFSPRHPQQELALCQRYFELLVYASAIVATAASQLIGAYVYYAVTKRTTANITNRQNTGGATNVTFNSFQQSSPYGVGIYSSSGSAGQMRQEGTAWADAEL